MEILDGKLLIKDDLEDQIITEEAMDLASSKSRRPPNGYILYCLEKRGELRNTHPDLPNIEISKMLGQNWKSLDENERRPYKEKAKDLQAEFKKDHPEYKYEKARKKRINKEITTATDNNPDTSVLRSLKNFLNLNSKINGIPNSNLLNGSESHLTESLALALKTQLSKIPPDFLKQIHLNKLNVNPIPSNPPPMPNISYVSQIKIHSSIPDDENSAMTDLLNLPMFCFASNAPSQLDFGIANDDSALPNDFPYLSADFQTQFE